MTSRTIFLARLIGLAAIVLALAMLTQRQGMVETVNAVIQDRAVVLIAGMVWLIAGLAMVLSHNVWSGGVLPVVVTLIGWSLTVRGLILLLVPPNVLAWLFQLVRFGDLFYVYVGIVAVLGGYLTYAGFRSSAR